MQYTPVGMKNMGEKADKKVMSPILTLQPLRKGSSLSLFITQIVLEATYSRKSAREVGEGVRLWPLSGLKRF